MIPALATAARKAWSLFVDDLGLAVGAIITVLLSAATQGAGMPDIAAPLLFAGLALAVLISVWRRARRRD